MLAVQIAAYSSRLADKEEIMQNSHTDGEHVWNGGQIVGGAALFLDLPVFAPFLIGGVTLSGLGKLSPRFHLLERRLWIVSVLPMVRQIVFCFGAKKMVLLYKENS